MNMRASEKAAIAALLAMSAVFFFYRLGSFALIGPDEPRYAQVAREMLQRRDLITPTIGGHLWAEKPVLTYWLMMLSMSLVGVNEWGARLPSALLAMLTALAVYAAGRRLISQRFGFLSAVVLITSVMFAGFAHAASTDMPLSAMMALGMCSFLLFEREPSARASMWMLVAYACFALAVLAKGLVGIVLPAGIIGTYGLLTGQWRRIRDARLSLGIAIFLAVASSWYGPVIARHGWTFIDEFFISHHFQRFVTPKFHHPGPPYYFLPVILLGLFPWTAFLVSAITRLRWSDLKRGDPRDRLRWFSSIWILVPLVFFSLSQSKLPGYILPVLPAGAFLIGDELDRLLTTRLDRRLTISLYATSVLVIAVGASGVLYARKELSVSDGGGITILGVAMVTGIVFLYWGLKRRFRWAIAVIVLGSAVALVIVARSYLPAIESKESLRRLAQIALREMKPGERIIGYYAFHHSLTFYTNARSFYDEKGNVIVARSPEELLDRVRREGSVLCVTRDDVFEDLVKDVRFRIQPLGRQRRMVLMRIRPALKEGKHQ
ncbi:MAG: glycosyltransferase family 39 protein [Acidobacteria bacterium]|nr:MAG: glycosyltransferase family 39 protein [Acidobacteriota bacterium]